MVFVGLIEATRPIMLDGSNQTIWKLVPMPDSRTARFRNMRNMSVVGQSLAVGYMQLT